MDQPLEVVIKLSQFAVSELALVVSSVLAQPITTTGSGVGKHGDIVLQVTFDKGHISQIDVVKSNENAILTEKVFTDLKSAIIANNTTQVDSIAGATLSSEGFKRAVEEAEKKAKVTLSDKRVAIASFNTVIPEKPVYDVIVIGAGGAGFSAAITAKDADTNVVMLEKMPSVGGNSLISGAEMAVANNWVQKKLGITGDSVELHYQDTKKGGDFRGDPDVVRTMVTNAADAAQWCCDTIGVQVQEDNLFFFGGHSKKRSLIPKGATGAEFISKFTQAAEERHIPILTNVKAEELIQDSRGRVVGVKATLDGKAYQFTAKKGMILATGGFGDNVDMRTVANPFYGEKFKTTNMPSATGDGIRMAQKVGAQVVNMELIQTYPMCDPNSGAIELIDDARFEGAILVNQEGKRFVEELARRDVMSKAILEQTGRYCYAIFNDAIEKKSHAITHHQDEVETFTKTGILHKGETLDDIANFFKIPVENLKATVARVNTFAKTGNDTDFHYRARFTDLSTGPYWIYRGVPSVHHTMGDLKINTHAQVLNDKNQPIPGLWAAGEVTGTTHGTNRLGSNAYTDIIVFGRIAGQEVAK